MSVFKDDKGRWGFSVRYTDVFGNRKQKKSVNKDWTKKQAKLEEQKFLAKETHTAMTFDEFREIYMQSVELRLKNTTLTSKDIRYNKYIKPYFGQLQLEKIDEAIVEKWQAMMLKTNLKNWSLKAIQGELIAMLNFAHKRRFIIRPIVIHSLKTNEPLEKKQKIVTKKQFDDICEKITNRMVYVNIQLLYYSGMRIGESLALTEHDIDGNTIHITKNRSRDGEITSTKTNEARDVVVSDRIIELLNERIAYYKNCGIKGTIYIFGGHKPVAHQSIQIPYTKVCDELGIEPRNLHALRHTHVSNLIALGFNTFEISERTGHSVKMINEIYGHVINNPQANMAQKLENL